MAKSRRDINTLDEIALSDYIHALDVLRERSDRDPDDEAGYDFQAALHNNQFVGPCEHGNDVFMAWHRVHLHYFEQLLQAADPPRTSNVTIPYWDWIHPEAQGKFPSAFGLPGLSAARNEREASLPADTLKIVIEETDWLEFGGYPKGDPNGDYGRLERGPHNTMHPSFIGGKMANAATAAEDPIYWSFHAFIDLLWAEWQRRNGMPAPTSPDGPLRGFTGKPRRAVRDVHNTIELDYEYEYTPKLTAAFGVPALPASNRILLATGALQPLFARDLRDELGSVTRAQFGLPELPAAAQLATIRLSSLKVPFTGSYTLRAFVHPRDVPFSRTSTEFAQRFGVGYVTMWQAHGATGHGGHHDHGGHDGPPAQPTHPASCTVRFNVTERLVGLSSERVRDLVLTLLYIPAPGPDGTPQPDPELVREVELRSVLLEAYSK